MINLSIFQIFTAMKDPKTMLKDGLCQLKKNFCSQSPLLGISVHERFLETSEYPSEICCSVKCLFNLPVRKLKNDLEPHRRVKRFLRRWCEMSAYRLVGACIHVSPGRVRFLYCQIKPQLIMIVTNRNAGNFNFTEKLALCDFALYDLLCTYLLCTINFL